NPRETDQPILPRAEQHGRDVAIRHQWSADGEVADQDGSIKRRSRTDQDPRGTGQSPKTRPQARLDTVPELLTTVSD
ncbi:hypothetical protein PENTCL1PPCAC_20158, partial [Pristionchus entomophagus]